MHAVQTTAPVACYVNARANTAAATLYYLEANCVQLVTQTLRIPRA